MSSNVEVAEANFELAAKAFIPSSDFRNEVEPGSLKAVKLAHQRMDSLIWVPPADLVILEGHNGRIDTPEWREHLEGITESILQNGFDPTEPLKAYVRLHAGENQLVVNDGHTRLLATLEAVRRGANVDKVPVMLLAKTTTGADLIFNQIRSNNGKRPYQPYELALLAKRALGHGASEAEIAREMTKTPGYINGLLLLSSAPREVGRMIVEGRVAAATVIDLIREHGQLQACKILAEAVAAKAKAGQGAGNGGGQGRVTKKDLPGAQYHKVLRKSSEQMHGIVRAVHSDPGYASLASETREKLAELLEMLDQAKGPADATADDSQMALLAGDGSAE